MGYLFLIRHGESLWNKKNCFTGWVDVPLSDEGIRQAREAGKRLHAFPPDIVFVSSLLRAQMTAVFALTTLDRERVPVIKHPEGSQENKWGNIYNQQVEEKEIIPLYVTNALNERMYGHLQGCNKEEIQEKHGKDQVHLWRRSYSIAPPEGESLQMTAQRTIPYFQKEILPHVREGKNVCIFAHGNSLRSIIMDLEQLSEKEVLSLELTLGEPISYAYQEGKLCRPPLST